jgi:hypothetical protein
VPTDIAPFAIAGNANVTNPGSSPGNTVYQYTGSGTFRLNQ